MRTALYARVSTQEQAVNGHSIDEQVERMRKYCDAMGWSYNNPYIDAGFSGANLERPALRKMIFDIQNGLVDRVLVYKLDRLSRSQKDTLYLIEDVFFQHHAAFVSMSENFDTESPFGVAMIGILAVFAQLEREQIKERMHMGKEARANQGKFNGGTAPVGYDYADGELRINPYEAMQVKDAFLLAEKGIGFASIAESLNAKGYSHKYGPWSENTVKHVLASRVYLGENRFGKNWYAANHPSIIDTELYDRVRSIVEKRSEWHRSYNRRMGLSNTLLGGLLLCAHCGAKYSKYTQNTVHDNGKRYRYEKYACNSITRKKDYLVKDPNCKNKKWNVEELDGIVIAEIKKLRLDPSPDGKRQDADPIKKREALISEELRKTDEQLSRLLDLYSLGTIQTEALQSKVAAVNDRRTKLEHELETIYTAPQTTLSTQAAGRIIASLDDVMQYGTLEEKRAVIAELIEKIELDGDDVKIFWTF